MVVALLATAGMVGTTAHADPPSGGTTSVSMPMPRRHKAVRGFADTYNPPSTTLTVQDGAEANADGVVVSMSGAGIDRDGTNGAVNLSGIDGVVYANGMESPMTGPMMDARPQFRAAPAPGKSK